MINFDDLRKEIIKRHNADMSQILDHPQRMFTIKGSGSREKKFIIWSNKSAA